MNNNMIMNMAPKSRANSHDRGKTVTLMHTMMIYTNKESATLGTNKKSPSA